MEIIYKNISVIVLSFIVGILIAYFIRLEKRMYSNMLRLGIAHNKMFIEMQELIVDSLREKSKNMDLTHSETQKLQTALECIEIAKEELKKVNIVIISSD